VIYQGVDAQIFYRMDDAAAQESFLKAHGIEGPYILFVGTIEPRKNLVNLLEAFSILKQRKYPGRLVIAGMQGWMSDDLKAFVSKLGVESFVTFLGFVEDSGLRVLYNKADVFAFPSFYEGFGFPIVEAMSCGAPVVTSDTSSCAEVAGDAALTVSPRDPKAIAEAITKIHDDRVLRGRLIENGLERSRQFSFVSTAKETLKVYQELGAGR
jgi:glycosyltransferase involved in cell wall biosynthesis